MTLRSSGFWSLTLGFFLLMQGNQTPIPADPEQNTLSFSNQIQAVGAVDDTSGKVSISVFETTDCSECHAFALNSVVEMEQLYRHNPAVELNVYLLPGNRSDEEKELEKEMLNNLTCLDQQDQFWPIYYEFHAKEQLLNSSEIEELILSNEFEVDLDQLKTCLAENDLEKTLEANRNKAAVKQIEIYPSTLIQEVQFIHHQPLENLVRVVNEKAMEINKAELQTQ